MAEYKFNFIIHTFLHSFNAPETILTKNMEIIFLSQEKKIKNFYLNIKKNKELKEENPKK